MWRSEVMARAASGALVLVNNQTNTSAPPSADWRTCLTSARAALLAGALGWSSLARAALLAGALGWKGCRDAAG